MALHKDALRLGLLSLAVALATGTSAAQAQDPDPTVTPAFSLQQQTDGQTAFLANCAIGCHQPDLAGLGPIAPLKGPRFMTSWAARTVGELTEQIRTAMPPTNAGGLSQETYLNIVAFI